MICKNCNADLSDEDLFCRNCGQKVISERISLKQLLQDLIETITNVERGLIFTVKELTIRPFSLIQNYINGKTKPYYGPMRFLILWVTISVIINISLGLFDEQQETISNFFTEDLSEESIARQQEISRQFKKYANILPMLVVPFVSLMTLVFFKKGKLNYAEHLVTNAYLSGFTSLVGTIYQLIFWLMGIPVFQGLFFTNFINTAYYIWVYKKLFPYPLLSTLIRTSLSLIIGFIIFSIFSGALGILFSIFFIT